MPTAPPSQPRTPPVYRNMSSSTAGSSHVHAGGSLRSGYSRAGYPASASSAFTEPPPPAPNSQQNFGKGPKSSLSEGGGYKLPPLARIRGHEKEPVPGVDYYMIGDHVKIRRYNKTTKKHTQWLVGTVRMPFFAPRGIEVDNEPRRRAYEVEYYCPVDRKMKLGAFFPHLRELDCVKEGEEFSNERRSGLEVVYAQLEHPYQNRNGYLSFRRIWTPCIESKGKTSVTVRALAGHAKNAEFEGAVRTMPYLPEVVQELRERGEEVVGDGREVFR
ncbi:hypothetical protein BDQ17DRAFT_1329563 [Cyathus striatus]|nr:hypothetical protein BDQ17DRAFT_1329563 [Cyathus striatus]